VFNSHYLAYFDIALTELWRATLGSYAAMTERGADVVVAEATVRFRSPARFDDELDVEIAVESLGTTSMVAAQRVTRPADGVLIAEGRTVHVFVDPATMTRLPIPGWIREPLSAGAGPEGGAPGVPPG
jgi:acyl-CoA thioester hydrolase